MSSIVSFQTIPELFKNLVKHFEGQSKPALRFKSRETKEWVDITWKDLERRVHALAGYFHKLGIRPGDRIAVLSENRPQWAIADMATQILGAINVSLYTSLPAAQVGYIIRDSGARTLVVSTSLQLKKAVEVFDSCKGLESILTINEPPPGQPAYVRHWTDAVEEGAAYWSENQFAIDRLADSVKPEDISALIYTSGTTGNPKGVMLTHSNFSSNVHACLDAVPFGPTDHHLSFLPLCHSFERTAGYLAVLACGATISYAESVDAINRNLMEVRPTVMISVPRLFERVYNLIVKSVEEGPAVSRWIFWQAVRAGEEAASRVRTGRRLGALLSARVVVAHKVVFSKLHERLGGNLRFAVSGGAKLPPSVGGFFDAAGINILEGYGLTETAPVLSVNRMDRARIGTVGEVLPGITVAIQDPKTREMLGQLSGEDCPSDLTTGEGEILARGPNIMMGYWNDDAATKEAIDRDGWYHTGDVGRFDDGHLVITDRIKHMIVSKGGKNIYPGPIEESFKTVPWIEQILVVGEGREFLTALIVPEMDSLRHYARTHGIDHATDSGLIHDESIRKMCGDEFKRYSRQAAAHEKIRDFRLVLDAFTIENGLLTPTMKPKRRLIEQEYAGLIEDMYEGVV
jgi:long-chain acyl-CoA synthetase